MAGKDDNAGKQLLERMLSHSDRRALTIAGDSYSYGDLLSRVSAYQYFARRNGLTASDITIFHGEPGLDFYAALISSTLGTFTVAFLSTRAADPVIKATIDALDPALVIGDGDYTSLRAHPIKRTIRDVDLNPRTVGDPQLFDTPTAFLSLTSGTLGRPTCAFVDSVALAEFLRWATKELSISANDRWFEGADATSDLALTNSLMAFSGGAALSVALSSERLHLARLASSTAPTIMRIVPPVARLMLGDARRRSVSLPALRLLAFGGDVLDGALPNEISTSLNCTPRMLNTYGKTELAGFSLYNWFLADRESISRPTGIVPLGQPVPGISILIDRTDRADWNEAYFGGPDAPEDAGELVISGATVSLRIVSSMSEAPIIEEKPFAGSVATIRTGDLVRQGSNGVEYVGRVDREVKVNGTRVNLDRLDALISHHCNQKVCILLHDGHIVAIVETKKPTSVRALSEILEGRVPAVLIPKEVLPIIEMPRTRSGKINIAECKRILSERTTS